MMSDYLETTYRENERRIKASKPKKGQFVQLNTWFGDVWAEIESVYISDGGRYCSVTIYKHGRNPNDKKTSTEFFYRIRKVSKTIPRNANVLHVREGEFMQGFVKPWARPFSEIPERIKRKFDK